MPTLNLLCADNLDIHLYQGDTLAGVVQFFDAEDAPLPVTATAVQMTVKRSAADTAALHTFTSGNGLAVTGHQVSLVALGQLARGTYYYDLKFTFASQVVTYLMGFIRVV
jgi:hypothetical protein